MLPGQFCTDATLPMAYFIRCSGAPSSSLVVRSTTDQSRWSSRPCVDAVPRHSHQNLVLGRRTSITGVRTSHQLLYGSDRYPF